MVPPFLSFPASEVDPQKLSRVMTDYLDYEHVRLFRRLLLKRLAIVAASATLIAWLFDVLWRPPYWVVLALIAAAALHAAVLELKARSHLLSSAKDIKSS